MITPDSCPKYAKCSANICPIDPDWQLRTHMKGERICLYLREYVKQGGIARLRGSLPKEMLEKIALNLPDIWSRYGNIKRSLERAAKTDSKIDALKKPGRAAA